MISLMISFIKAKNYDTNHNIVSFGLSSNMLVKLFSVFFVLPVAVVNCASTHAAGKAESCEAGLTDTAWNRMEVLPGTGWDNLYGTWIWV